MWRKLTVASLVLMLIGAACSSDDDAADSGGAEIGGARIGLRCHDGRYWTGFDRQYPIEGPARSQTWSGTAHGLVAELGVGTVTHTALQMGLVLAGVLAGVLAATGPTTILGGLGLVWASRAKKESTPDVITEATPEPSLVN